MPTSKEKLAFAKRLKDSDCPEERQGRDSTRQGIQSAASGRRARFAADRAQMAHGYDDSQARQIADTGRLAGRRYALASLWTAAAGGYQGQAAGAWREISARRRKRSNSLPRSRHWIPKDRTLLEEFDRRACTTPARSESRASTSISTATLKKPPGANRAAFLQLAAVKRLGGPVTRRPPRPPHQAALVFDCPIIRVM